MTLPRMDTLYQLLITLKLRVKYPLEIIKSFRTSLGMEMTSLDLGMHGFRLQDKLLLTSSQDSHPSTSF